MAREFIEVKIRGKHKEDFKGGNMNNEKLLSKLKELNACIEAVKFCKGKDLKTAWNKCERADWLLWFICKLEIGTKKERIHVICDCAATALKYVPKGEDRPRLTIEAARKYADEPTQENLERAGAVEAAAEAATWAATWAAEVATWAAGAATGAAEAAAWAATGAAEAAARAATGAAEAAARAATGAVEAAAGAATGAVEAAAGAAGAATHKKMCKMIRAKISIDKP
jgi:hypothetical protein